MRVLKNPFGNTVVKIQAGYPNYNSWHAEYGGSVPAQSTSYHGGEDWTPYDNSATSAEPNWYLYPIFPDSVTGNTWAYIQPSPLPANAPSYYSSDFAKTNPYGIQFIYYFQLNGYTYLVKYCHLEPDSVPTEFRAANAPISPGVRVATTGKTGNCKTSRSDANGGRHLHIELYRHAGSDYNNWDWTNDRLRPSEYINFITEKTSATTVNSSGQFVQTESYLAFDTRNKGNAIFITPNGSMVHVVRPREVEITKLTNYYISVCTFDPYFYTDKLIELIDRALDSAIDKYD